MEEGGRNASAGAVRVSGRRRAEREGAICMVGNASCENDGGLIGWGLSCQRVMLCDGP